jgi:hypothetical protein
LQFTSNFCGGDLIRSINPFEAITVNQPLSYAHQFEMGNFTFYAYSIGTPSYIYGNRCPFTRILVDQNNSAIYGVHLLRQFHLSDSHESPFHPQILQPDVDSPIIAIGMTTVDSSITLMFDEFCLDMIENIHYGDEFSESAQEFPVGSIIQIKIDGLSMPDAIVTEQQKLSPVNIDSDYLVDSRSENYQYCISPRLDTGSHTIEMEFSLDSEAYSYSWEFYYETGLNQDGE